MRYIAAFLLLLNIGYFAWLQWLAPVELETIPAEEDRPLLNSGLLLLSEFREQAGRISELDTGRCYLIGEFATVDEARGLIEQIQTANREALLLMAGEPLVSQYRVYLPPASSRQIATLTLEGLSEALAEAGFEAESYLITRGLLENAIALGVFDSEEAALQIQQQVTSLGYSPFIEEVPRSTGGIFIEVSGVERLRDSDGLEPSPDATRSELENESSESSQWLDFLEDWPDLEVTENLCQIIAQGSQFP